MHLSNPPTTLDEAILLLTEVSYQLDASCHDVDLMLRRLRMEVENEVVLPGEQFIEDAWTAQKGCDPETGKGWLTPRMERAAARATKEMYEQEIEALTCRVSELTVALDRQRAAFQIIHDRQNGRVGEADLNEGIRLIDKVLRGENGEDLSLPKINVVAETRTEDAIGTTALEVVRVEREDDGSFTAVVPWQR